MLDNSISFHSEPPPLSPLHSHFWGEVCYIRSQKLEARQTCNALLGFKGSVKQMLLEYKLYSSAGDLIEF